MVNLFFVFTENERLALGEPFSFEDMFSRDYKPRQFAAQWLGGEWIVYADYFQPCICFCRD